MKPLVSASILAADPLALGADITRILAAGAGWLHVDVMDGRYVPNITCGPALVAALAKQFEAPLDVHLMIEEPERYIEEFARAGADYITIHPEPCRHVHRALASIRGAGGKAGLALNPATPVGVLEHVIDQLDLILLMSVNPGFGGQSFITGTYKKLQTVAALLTGADKRPLVAVDGGVGPDNAARLRELGVDVLVAGSAVFGAADSSLAIRHMLGRCC